MGCTSRLDMPDAIALPDYHNEHVRREHDVRERVDARCEGQSGIMTDHLESGFINVLSIEHEYQKERSDVQRLQ